MTEGLPVSGAKTQHFSYRNVDFLFHLFREERKTMSATVLPSQTVLVKVPVGASDDRIQEFLRRKCNWVLKQKRYFSQFRQQREKRYESGESFLFRGRKYKLQLLKANHDECTILRHGVIHIQAFNPHDRGHVKNLLESWYRVKAHTLFAERLVNCFSTFPHSRLPRLIIRKMNRRWGSYSPKTHSIVLNSELIKASTRHIDYVIQHELCHILHPKHNRLFYLELSAISPNWRHLKSELELQLLS